MKKLLIISLLIIIVLISGCATVPENDYTPIKEIILEEVLPKENCYNDTYNVYGGEINNTCYFYGCIDECKGYIARCMEWGDSLRFCLYDYTYCTEDCTEDIEDYNRNRIIYDAHEWGCIINETVKVVNTTRCY